MELLWFLGFVAGLVLLAMVGAGVAFWAQLHRAKFEMRVKQDMLARGLSVEDIERLLKASSDPTPGRVLPVGVTAAKEPVSLAAYRLAGVLMNMVESGRDTPEIVALLEVFLQQSGEASETGREPAQPLEPAAGRRADIQRLCSGLAPALESMVQAGRTQEEIAGLLDTFLQRSGEPPERGKAPDQPFPPIGAAVRSSDIQRLGSGRDG